jgi:hypothetical protein
MGQEDRRRNTAGQNGKEKKEIKTGKDFYASKNCKFDSNGFLFKNSLKHMQV